MIVIINKIFIRNEFLKFRISFNFYYIRNHQEVTLFKLNSKKIKGNHIIISLTLIFILL